MEESFFFKYSNNIEINCEVDQKNQLSVEFTISEASIAELEETVGKFVDLFKKLGTFFFIFIMLFLRSFTWEFGKSMERFTLSEHKKE